LNLFKLSRAVNRFLILLQPQIIIKANHFSYIPTFLQSQAAKTPLHTDSSQWLKLDIPLSELV